MKYVLTVLCLFSLSRFAAQVPDWAWAAQGAGTAGDEIKDVAVDVSGNIYATGFFSSAQLSLAGSTLNNSGSGKQFLLIKFSKRGEALWAKSAGGTDDEEGTALAIDGTGNVYVFGNYESASVSFGNHVLSNKSSAGQADMFLVKYSAAGNVLWAKSYGGSLLESANDVAVDASGNVCLTGNFFSLSVLFDNYGVINSGVSDAFVAMVNGSGVAQWAKRIGGGQTDNGSAVGIDNSGNVLVSGNYNSNTVSSFSPALSNSGGFDVYIAKYDQNGNLLQAQRFGGSGDEGVAALSMQGNGTFFLCGYFESGSIAFGSTTLSKSGARSMYLVRYNASVTSQWAVKATGSQNSIPAALEEDGADLYMAGSFDLSSLAFGSVSLSNGGSLDGFVVSYNAANGAVQWARTTGSADLEQVQGLGVGGGFVHVGGLFTNTLVLRDNMLQASGATDAFVAKLCYAPAAPLSASGNTVCPGLQVTLTGAVPPGSSPVWFNAATGGSTVHQGATYNAAPGNTFYLAARDTVNGCGMVSASRIAATGAAHPPANPVVTVSGHTLTASGNGSVSAWYDCGSTTVIGGQQGSTFILNGSGNFAVIMQSAQGCADTSACSNYSFTEGSDTVIVVPGITGNDELQQLSVYPNPSNGIFYVEAARGRSFDLVDALGQTLQHISFGNEDQGRLTLGPLPAGIYFLVAEDRRLLIKLIVDR